MTEMRKGQVRLGPRSWGVIREAYLGGVSAGALAERYGCSVGTIRYRAVREGWRRCDVEGFEPSAPAAPEPADEEAADLETLERRSIASAMRSVRAGRPAEAAAYLRVVEVARRLAKAAHAAEDRWDDDPYDGDDCEPADINEVNRQLEERLERLAAQLERKRAAAIAERGED